MANRMIKFKENRIHHAQLPASSDTTVHELTTFSSSFIPHIPQVDVLSTVIKLNTRNIFLSTTLNPIKFPELASSRKQLTELVNDQLQRTQSYIHGKLYEANMELDDKYFPKGENPTINKIRKLCCTFMNGGLFGDNKKLDSYEFAEHIDEKIERSMSQKSI